MLLFTYQHNTNKLGSQLLHCITGYQTKENTKPWHGYVLWQMIHTGFFWRQKNFQTASQLMKGFRKQHLCSQKGGFSFRNNLRQHKGNLDCREQSFMQPGELLCSICRYAYPYTAGNPKYSAALLTRACLV